MFDYQLDPHDYSPFFFSFDISLKKLLYCLNGNDFSIASVAELELVPLWLLSFKDSWLHDICDELLSRDFIRVWKQFAFKTLTVGYEEKKFCLRIAQFSF